MSYLPDPNSLRTGEGAKGEVLEVGEGAEPNILYTGGSGSVCNVGTATGGGIEAA